MTILVYRSRRPKYRRPRKLIPFQFQRVGFTTHHSIHFVRRKLGNVRKKRVYQYQFLSLHALASVILKGRAVTNSSTQFISSIVSAQIHASSNSIFPAILNARVTTATKALFNPVNVNTQLLIANLITKIASRINPTVKTALKAILSSGTKAELTQLPSRLQIAATSFIKASGSAAFVPTTKIAIGRSSILVYRSRRLNRRFFRPKRIFSKNNPPGSISLTGTGTIITTAFLKPLVVPGLVYLHPIPLRKIKQRRHKGGRPFPRRYPFQFTQRGFTDHHSEHFVRRKLGNVRKRKIYPPNKQIGLLATINSVSKQRAAIIVNMTLSANAATKVMTPGQLGIINQLISIMVAGGFQTKSISNLTGKLTVPKSIVSTKSKLSISVSTAALAINSIINTGAQSLAQGTVKLPLKTIAAAQATARSVVTSIGATVALLAFGSAITKAKALTSGTLGISGRATTQFKPKLVVTNIATLISVLATGASQVKASAVFFNTLGITARTTIATKSPSPMLPIAVITAMTSSFSKLTTRFIGKLGLFGTASTTSSLSNSITQASLIVGKIVSQATLNVVGPVAAAGLSAIASAKTIVSQAAMSVANFPAPLIASLTFMGVVSLGNKVLSVLTGIPVKGEGNDDNVTGSGP